MTFEDLESWQQARQLTKQIYSVTRADRIARDFGLCSQIQRAGVSAMSNLAEGFERHHVQEKLQFYNVAHASTAEVRSLTYVIEDNYPTLAADAVELRERAVGTAQGREESGERRGERGGARFALGASGGPRRMSYYDCWRERHIRSRH